MIKLDVIGDNHQHFVVAADEPVRIEVVTVNGVTVARVYRGAAIDMQQEPLGMFDGNSAINHNWVTYRPPEGQDA